jgi:hypothetical protein
VSPSDERAHDHDDSLTQRERGYAVAAVRLLGPQAEARCAQRSAALKRQARALLADAERLRGEAHALDRLWPSDADEAARVDPSWCEAPPPVAAPAIAAWLNRRAYGHLAAARPLIADASSSARPALPVSIERFERLSGSELSALIVGLGRRRVAMAFSGASRAAVAQLCARIGEPHASALVAELRALARKLAPEEVRVAQRAIAPLALDEPAEGGPEVLFFVAGAAWLAPALDRRSPERLARLAERLPRALGERLLESAHQPSTERACRAALDGAGVVLESLAARAL